MKAGNVGDSGLIPQSERFPGEGNGKPLQYSCLENSIDRGTWQATVHGVTKSQTQLSTHAFKAHELITTIIFIFHMWTLT